MSGKAFDDSMVLKAEAVHTGSAHTQAVISSEQSLPIPGMLNFTRLRMQVSPCAEAPSHPVPFTTSSVVSVGAMICACGHPHEQGSKAFLWRDFTFSMFGQCGSVNGDLPPYVAFLLGGTNSIRGYYELAVGSGSR